MFIAKGVTSLARRGGGLRALLSAAVLGQLIGLAALPLITRLYSPADFGILATYAATLAIIAPVAAWRFDAAIPAAKTDREGDELLLLALGAGVLTALVCTLMIELFVKYSPIAPVGLRDPWLRMFMPLGIVAASWTVALQFAAIRRKQFSIIGITRLIQPAVGSSVQVGFGCAGLTQGLVIGHFINSGAGVSLLFRRQWPSVRRRWKVTSPKRLRQVARAYRHFPRQSVLEELARNLSLQLPLLLLATWMGAVEAGVVFMAMRLLGTPQVVLANSISQLFYGNCRTYSLEGRLGSEVLRLTERLSLFFILPMLFFGWLGAPLAGVVFGETWKPLGALIGWMLPWYALRVLMTSISPALYVIGETGFAARLAIIGLVLHLLPLSLAKWWAPTAMAEALALGAGAFYAIGGLILIARLAAGAPQLGPRLARLTLTWTVAFAAGYVLFHVLPKYLFVKGI